MSDNPILESAKILYDETEQETTKVVEEPTETEKQEPSIELEKLDTPKDLESDEELDENNDDENTQYLELNGKEYDLEEVKKWQSGHLMQSDYTKKTTALADERKTFEAERDTSRENLLTDQSKVTEMRDLLAVLVEEDESIDWEDLKAYQPEEYIEQKEKADKRKAALEKVKAERNTPADDPNIVIAEKGKLFAANPKWVDDNKQLTETYTKDIALMNNYVAKEGFAESEFKSMTRAHQLMAILKAAKYDELQKKGREIKSTREKVPLVTKPKKVSKNQQKTASEIMYPAG